MEMVQSKLDATDFLKTNQLNNRDLEAWRGTKLGSLKTSYISRNQKH